MLKFGTLITLIGCVLSSPVSATEESRPNILFILVDDLGYADLGCQGSEEIRTPHIDGLAASGFRFTDAYVTAPQCGPSRAGIMTGVHQARFGYGDNEDNHGLPDPQTLPLMPEYLKQAGYRTGLVGKWHIGQGTEAMLSKPERDEYRKVRKVDAFSPKRVEAAKPWKRGFDEGLFFVGGGGQYFPFRQKFSKSSGSKYFTFNGPDKQPEPFRGSADAFKTDFLTDAAIDFIKSKDKKPWFLYVSYTAPHTPLQAKPKDIAANTHIKDPNRRILAGMMTCLDYNVGRILEHLDEQGLRENTLVVFLSDNGGPTSKNTSRNDPFSGVKGDVFEGGIRVPMIASWPGNLAKGKVVSGPVISLDLLPTFMAVAGKKAEQPLLEGKNLLPWLTGKTDCPNDELYWSWRGNFNAVRMGTIKEIRNGKPVKAVDGTAIPAHNFVDLVTNPRELAGDHALKNEDKIQRLSTALDAWLSSVKEDADKLTPSIVLSK
ncbi:sulfatase-like hydrolase/transferase [Rhodopirellula sp. SWK7]|uniref:sulfatase-like hydrolase/transferase n=1 Tax=Rhodopirellula sp. SWK7 TaxID=595460 RepID=UPI0002C03CC5|nr:sulfatase-like hydrolase/transferase [Rhodopirellula sp. SWK7]EMI43769.1 N-acetylgalactosamine-4-sulfatase [Rhodopirellula sp. SWK7]